MTHFYLNKVRFLSIESESVILLKLSRPYDVTDVIEQYSQGHLSLTNKVNQVQVKVDQMADQLNRQQILFNNLGSYFHT